MDRNSEYHDPNYPVPSTSRGFERPVLNQDDKLRKIRVIVEKEFASEINTRQEELNKIEQRLWWSRMYLHKLRTATVTQYYNTPLTQAQVQEQIAEQHEPRAKAAVSAILKNEQKRLHPSVKKLLGKRTVDIEEIFKFRGPRSAVRKNYMAMLQKKNSTIPAENITTLRPDSNPDQSEIPCSSKRVPRSLKPKLDVINVNECKRNKQKTRYRIIIGNTSKYAPPSSKVDRSTHKWLLYIRGPHSHPDVSGIICSVNVTLHDSYSPHHNVLIDKPPFHLSRRGWGEFPAKLKLNFKLPEINRPVHLEHTIKLDRNYTGLQTLGSETVVDLWLYSNQEMMQYAFNENETTIPRVQIKEEIPENAEEPWLEYFTEPKNIEIDEMLVKQEIKEERKEERKEVNLPIEEPNPGKRLVKYIDPSSKKIYYLEMDRSLDVNMVQEIIINAKTSINGLNSNSNNKNEDYPHIRNDHCYISKLNQMKIKYLKREQEKCKFYDELCTNVSKFTCVRVAVMYLLSKVPIVSKDADLRYFPFMVPNVDVYWSYDITKRRNIEWSRAKLINKILQTHFQNGAPIWRTKQILLYSRLYGYYPMKTGDIDDGPPVAVDRNEVINTLNVFPDDKYKDDGIREIDLTLEDDVDVESLDPPNIVNDETSETPHLEFLTMDDKSNYDIYAYIEETCSKLGIIITNNDIGNGYCYSIIHALIHCAMKKFAEELIRSSLACKLINKRKKVQELNGVNHLPVWESWEGLSLEVLDICMGAKWRLSSITNNSLGVIRTQKQYTPL